MEKSGYTNDKEEVNMKLTKEMKQLISCNLLVEFFKESAIPELKDTLPELIDSVYGVEEKLEEFSELIRKKSIEAVEKEVEGLANG
jgi:hypothetical protein